MSGRQRRGTRVEERRIGCLLNLRRGAWRGAEVLQDVWNACAGRHAGGARLPAWQRMPALRRGPASGAQFCRSCGRSVGEPQPQAPEAGGSSPLRVDYTRPRRVGALHYNEARSGASSNRGLYLALGTAALVLVRWASTSPSPCLARSNLTGRLSQRRSPPSFHHS